MAQTKEQKRAWRMKPENRAKDAERQRQRYREHPELVRKGNLGRYGLTPEEWDAMLAAQGSICAACGTNQPGDWHTDHNHQTGEVRGILCRGCNLALGCVEDSAERLVDLLSYLHNTTKGA